MSTFVALGNATQPFLRLLAAVSAAFERLPQPVFVQHGRTPLGDPRFEGAPFLDMEAFARRIAAARLVLCHAGAGSVLHALVAGKTPLVMPRRKRFDEAVDDHQDEFAEALARAGRVRVVESAGDLVRVLAAPAVEGVASPRPCSRMAELVAGALREVAEERR